MENETPKRSIFKRRQLVVNPTLQYVFIFYSLFIGAIFFTAGAVVTAIVTKYLTAREMGVQYFAARELLLFGLLLVLLAASLYFGLYISNRIAGPIFRLLRELSKPEVSDMKEIWLRKNDYFHDVAKAYNDILKQLQDHDPNKK